MATSAREFGGNLNLVTDSENTDIRSPEAIDDRVAPTERFSLRYLFFVMTSVAIGACLFGQKHFDPTIRGIGLSICLYWISKAFFVVSKSVPRIGRELVFLAGLPFYLGSLLVCLAAIVRSLWFVMYWVNTELVPPEESWNPK